MRARWEAIRTSLASSVTTLQAERNFKNLSATVPVLADFESPSHLIDFLTDRTGVLDQKDEIYRVLVRLIQENGDYSALGVALVWLGLWPGLDGIYRRRRRLFADDLSEIVSGIAEYFTRAVQKADLGRINRLAATLVMNTERDLVDGRRRAWATGEHEVSPPEDYDVEAPGGPVLEGMVQEERANAMWTRIREAVGNDAELLLAVAVEGLSQREAAERLGISHDAARKRYQRAVSRAKEAVGELVPIHLREPRLGGVVRSPDRRRTGNG